MYTHIQNDSFAENVVEANCMIYYEVMYYTILFISKFISIDGTQTIKIPQTFNLHNRKPPDELYMLTRQQI